MALTEGGPGRQAPYLAKGHWVIVDLGEIGPDDLECWLASSHALIAAKLTRAVRRELGLVAG
jgi:predicted DNA-binding protein (MmcQ/YjbR family)